MSDAARGMIERANGAEPVDLRDSECDAGEKSASIGFIAV